ncbi:MAG: glycosyltransferase family 4 protein [Planctomycetota bacterium]
MNTERRLRLAIVGDRYDPAGGGAERSTLQTARALAERGHDVTLFAGSGEPPTPDQRESNLAVRTYKPGRSSSVARLYGFARWASRELALGGFDASLASTPVVPATVVQPRGGTVVETQLRNVALRKPGWGRTQKQLSLALSPKQRLLRTLEARTYADPGVRRIAALSGYVERQLQTHFNVAPERIARIANLAAPPAAGPQERAEQRRSFRRALGVDDNVTAFVFAAENPRLKGLPTLMRALERLAPERPNLVVLLAGRIGFGVSEQAAERGVAQLIRPLGPTRRMDLLYAAGDAVVHPTHYDPSSKVVLEGLLYGLPAITTTYNGAADHLLPPEAPAPRGIVLDDPADDAALADALRTLSDPAELAEARNAIGDLTHQLSIDAHVQRLAALLYACAEEA